MEPDPLKPDPPDPDLFGQWLGANAALRPLSDDGFSAGVLARLPGGTPARASKRTLLCLLAAALGAAVALAMALAAPAASIDLTGVDGELREAVGLLGSPAAGAAIAATVLSMLYVFQSELRRWRLRIMGL
ncbi:MAG TPA: hypothetical protein VGM73_06350 [Candidatus Didemnitutus sp.]|jgi:hypothetical protein